MVCFSGHHLDMQKITMTRMDLFDLGTYFASYVPVRAMSNPLLKYAACAYAAKQLGRVKGAKAKMGGVCSRQAVMEIWPNKDDDFIWYGAKYYEKAIQLLMKELQPDADGPPPMSTPEVFGQWQAAELGEDAHNPRKRRRRISNSRLSRGVHSDEVLAATAILSVYEFLDATGPAWNRHLSGVKSLLDVAEIGIMPLEHHSTDGDSPYQQFKKSRLSKARKAAFWNFARQDYLAACECLQAELSIPILTEFQSSTSATRGSIQRTSPFGQKQACSLTTWASCVLATPVPQDTQKATT